MARGAVDVNRRHFVQDQRAGVFLERRRDLHPVRGDPIQRNLFFKVRDLLDIHSLGDALVGIIGDTLERDHLAGLARKGRRRRCAAYRIGLVHVGAAGQMAGAALQGRELDGAALAVQLVVDEVGQVAAGAAEDGLVAESVQLASGGDQIAQVGAVGGLHALAGCDDDVGLALLQLVYLGEELVRVKGNFRQKDEVGAFAVVAARKAGRTGQPARVAAHDLGHGHAADVVDGRVPDDFLQDGGNVLGCRAVAGGVVGQAQVVVDGLGHTDEPHRAAHPRAIAAELGDGVHRVVAADVEHRADVVLVKQGEQLDVGRGVRLRLGELVAAAAQIAGRRALEQLDAEPVVQQDVQLHEFLFQQSLDAVLHAVDLVCAQTAGGFIDACETGIDDGGRAAALADDDILGHENLLVPFTDKLDFLCAAAPLRAVPVSRSVHPAQCTDGGTANNR